MHKPSVKKGITEIPRMLSELLGIPQDELVLRKGPGKSKLRPDLIASAAGHTFIVEFKASARKASLLSTLAQISEYIDLFEPDAIPLVVVPYMGNMGQELCREHEVSWLDLSGNAAIQAPGLLIHVEGKPNLFKTVGRPSNAFAPKSSRIARQFLIQPHRSFTQRELAQATDLDKGHVSRIVRRLEQDNLITGTDERSLRVVDPGVLLDSWYEVYEFVRHEIIKGHIAARSGDELLYRIDKTLKKAKVEYAATGLGAAWLFTHFAGFRTTTFFLRYKPSEKVLQELGFRKDERGANTWLVVPNDDGIFHGSKAIEKIKCVHPVQIYLDLKGHPERAPEAATELRREYLSWKRDD
jgi:predicted transcriptional regulator